MNVADTLMSRISASVATVIASGAVPNTPDVVTYLDGSHCTG